MEEGKLAGSGKCTRFGSKGYNTRAKQNSIRWKKAYRQIEPSAQDVEVKVIPHAQEDVTLHAQAGGERHTCRQIQAHKSWRRRLLHN